MPRLAGLVGLLISLFCVAGYAEDITLLGLFPGKAVIVVNGGPLRTIAVGQKQPEGFTLMSTTTTTATIEINGKRQVLEMGQHVLSADGDGKGSSTTLSKDSSGHFHANGQINGRGIRLLVDTGATSVVLPANDARNIGIDYRKGQRGVINTANGQAVAYSVTLDSVAVGNITLYQVGAVIVESGKLDTPLLGMSFLGRMDMKFENQSLTLTKRY
ncbi:MAG: TIGR02281 family clan AA aspartic protease [Betaproteobacteria bacterium]|nr:TIGR02281 family clan AA aspartic protease [Betaproteobacteria bacterium]